MKNPTSTTKTRKFHKGGITPRMERFISEYLKDLNGTEAAIRAGYSKKTSGQIARRVLDNPEVQKRLKKKLNRQTRKADITIERVLNEYAAIAFANPMHYMQVDENGPYVDLEDLPEEYAAAMAEVSFEEVRLGKKPKPGKRDTRKRVRRVRFKLHNKTDALGSLGKYLEMFRDKVDMTHHIALTPDGIKKDVEKLFSDK